MIYFLGGVFKSDFPRHRDAIQSAFGYYSSISEVANTNLHGKPLLLQQRATERSLAYR
jgi:hypothetical protein